MWSRLPKQGNQMGRMRHLLGELQSQTLKLLLHVERCQALAHPAQGISSEQPSCL